MDLLYSQYSNPLDLMAMYINRGRFGEFVANVVDADYQKRKVKAEREDDWKLWTMYIHLLSSGMTENESFQQWKERVCKPTANTKTRDTELDETGMKSILAKLFQE